MVAVADSLLTLRDQVDRLFPLRSKRSDGTIGDAAHMTRDSDHNPWWVYGGQNWVTAIDITHDPDNGVDCNRLAYALTLARDSRVKYFIWDEHITDYRWLSRSGENVPPWTALPYSGPNSHETHLHLSVKADPISLSTSPWLLPGMEDDLPSVEEVWSKRVADHYTPQEDYMRADVALEWAAANAGFARSAAELALGRVNELGVKLDKIAEKLGV